MKTLISNQTKLNPACAVFVHLKERNISKLMEPLSLSHWHTWNSLSIQWEFLRLCVEQLVLWTATVVWWTFAYLRLLVGVHLSDWHYWGRKRKLVREREGGGHYGQFLKELSINARERANKILLFLLIFNIYMHFFITQMDSSPFMLSPSITSNLTFILFPFPQKALDLLLFPKLLANLALSLSLSSMSAFWDWARHIGVCFPFFQEGVEKREKKTSANLSLHSFSRRESFFRSQPNIM